MMIRVLLMVLVLVKPTNIPRGISGRYRVTEVKLMMAL